MAVKVRIPTPLRKLTNGQEEVSVDSRNMGELIEALERDYPGMKERLCDETGKVRRFINLYLNEEDIRFLQNLDTPLKDGDEVSIIPAIAGGAPIKKKVYLNFPQKLIKEPIIYQVGHKFQVVTNIRGASISDEIGIVALEIEGEPSEIEKAIEYMREKGVTVEPIELDVVE
jgi:molybdopterin synthase sulfur carrier subunit